MRREWWIHQPHRQIGDPDYDLAFEYQREDMFRNSPAIHVVELKPGEIVINKQILKDALLESYTTDEENDTYVDVEKMWTLFGGGVRG